MDYVITNQKQFTEKQLVELFEAVGWESSNYPERLKIAIESSASVYVAWDGERLIGLINALDDGALTCYVHYLLVLPEYQGKGIGSALLAKIKHQYANFVHLFLLAENKPLVDFYEKEGFTANADTTQMVIHKKMYE